MTQLDAEHAVIGLGAMGANALWRMAVRNTDVIGFEQFPTVHAHGSTHGHTRLFRTLCLEHPDLVPMAQNALALFRELEQEQQVHLVDLCGLLNIGRDGGIVTRVTTAAADHNMKVHRLSAADLRADHPQHAEITEGDSAVFDEAAGIGRPEAAVEAALAAAERNGARILSGTTVTAVEPDDDHVRVVTPARTFAVVTAVVTAGPWLYKLVPEITVRPIRTLLTWFGTRQPDDPTFRSDRFPAFIREWQDGHRIWGHGSGSDHGVKVGPEDDPRYHPVDPDTLDRSITAADWEPLSRIVDRYLPGLQPQPSSIGTCMVTRSPDGQFLVGPTSHPRVLVGGGCSGHGFKHSPAIGEALARMATGEKPLSTTDFIDPRRFS